MSAAALREISTLLQRCHSRIRLRDLAACFARVLLETSRPLQSEGAGNAGRRCARSRACSVVNTRVSHHGHTGNTRHSPRNGFTAYFVLSPVTGLFCHRHRRNYFHQLDTSVGVSGPHVFAVRLSAVRQYRRLRPPHPAAHVRDDRETPLERRRDPIAILLFLPRCQAKFRKFRSYSKCRSPAPPLPGTAHAASVLI